MKSSLLFLSVVVPIYNEVHRLKNLPKIIEFFQRQNFPTEIIAVNDGSSDGTLGKLHEYLKRVQFKLISYEKNQGKGYALKEGILATKGRYILFMDIDLSTPLGEFNKFLPFLKNHDVIIATRKIGQSELIKRQSKVRETLGKGFTFLSNIILGLEVSDFTCGFKCFSQKSAQEIFKKLTIKRWGFDAEVLFIAHKKGFTIKEVPVNWQNDPQTKVKFPRDIINSLTDLMKIRINGLRNIYIDKKS